MSNLDAVKKVMMYQKDKSGFVKEPTVKEMADLVVLVLSQVKVIEQAIKEGRLDGKTPIKDVDYVSKDSAIKMLTKAVNDALSNEEDKFISRVEGKFDSKVYQSEKKRDDVVASAIDRINTKLSEVKDGVVTEAEIRRAANLALGMIELPDFSELIKDSLDGETVRDVLSRLTGDKRYKVEISDVNGLAQAIAQVSQIRGQGGTIGKQQVYNFIRQAIADGTISGSGMGDMTASVYDPANKAEQVLTTGDIGVSVASQSHNHTGVYAPALGADDNYVTDAEKTKLSNLSGTNTGDQTTIAGITGTKAQFDTAVTDGNFMYVGDAPTSHVHALSEITDSTSEALGVGTLEVGHASDTTISRVSAGVVAVEGVNLVKENSNASAAEVNTGTSVVKFVTPDALAGSYAGTKTVSVQVSGSASGDTALATGDDKATLAIDTTLTGMNLIAVKAYVTTVSSSGAPLFQIRRSRRTNATTRSVADMLTTGVSIDANEFESADAATPVSINTSNDDVQTGDILLFDCDTAGTGTKGATLLLTFQLP